MFSIHRVPRRAFSNALSALCALLLCGLWTSCATVPRPTPSDAAGVVKVVVSLDGSVRLNHDPVVACFLGLLCLPPVNKVHWDLTNPAGATLNVKANPSSDGQPCRSFPKLLRYKRDPGFETIRCSGAHCETVGRPRETGCYKYDITVTPSSGKPVILDPDMIVM